jgi:PAS domain S-box-containing protein
MAHDPRNHKGRPDDPRSLETRLAELEAANASLQRQLEDLRSSQQGLTDILESTSDGFLALDEELRLIYINRAALRLLGRRANEVLGRQLFEAFPEARGSVFEEKYRRALRDKQPLHFETYFGAEPYANWYEVRVFPQKEGISVYFQVTTERQEVMRALTESERRYRSLFEAIGDGLFIHDLEGRFLEVNPAAARRLGYRREEMLGMGPGDIDDPAFAHLIPRRIEAIRREGRLTFETVHLARDGGSIPVEINSQIIDYQGRTAVLSVARDISERKEADRRLREERERFRALVEESPLGVALISPEGRYEYVSPRFVDLFGYTLEQVPDGRAWFRLAYPDPAQRRQAQAAWLADSGRGRSARERPRVFPVACARGEVKQIAFRCVILENGSKLVLYEDVSERVAAERDKSRLEDQLRQAQKLEAVGTLAGGIAHDFNNLLGMVSGFAELAQDLNRAGRDAGKELERIMQAAERGRNLVRQILTFSRKVESELEPLDLNGEVRQVAGLMRSTLPRSIVLELDLAPNLPMVSADANQMEQVLVNLCTNARDAMPSGGTLTIVTSVREAGEPGRSARWVELDVADTGHGMEPELLNHVFEPFFTTKEVGQGSGLGLAMVYGAMQAHHGFLECDSTPGRGTCFRLLLPAAPEAAQEVESAAPAEASDLSGEERVLFVDDEEGLREVGRRILERAGYRVLTAESGEQALEICRQGPGKIDLVVLDLSMPGMGGAACLQEIKRAAPKVKVLVSSGWGLPDDRQGLEQADSYLAKPYRGVDLLAKLRQLA